MIFRSLMQIKNHLWERVSICILIVHLQRALILCVIAMSPLLEMAALETPLRAGVKPKSSCCRLKGKDAPLHEQSSSGRFFRLLLMNYALFHCPRTKVLDNWAPCLHLTLQCWLDYVRLGVWDVPRGLKFLLPGTEHPGCFGALLWKLCCLTWALSSFKDKGAPEFMRNYISSGHVQRFSAGNDLQIIPSI